MKKEQGRVHVTVSAAVRPISMAAALALLPNWSAFAAELDDVVVSAARYEQKLSDVLADVTVIDSEVIERSGAASAEDILAKVPGVQITRNGGVGTNTELFVRGAHRQYTAVYLDGIRIDAQNGSGGAQWESIPLESIERIEVMRGAASAIYGSDAMAAAIHIVTKRGEGGWRPYVSWGAGTYRTQKSTAGFHGAHGAWDYALGLSYAHSDGFDSRPGAGSSARNPDKDSYVRKSANARLGLQLGAAQRLEFTALTSDSNAGYDAKPQLNDRTIRNLDAYGLRWEKSWSPAVTTRASVSESRSVYATLTSSASHTQTQLRNYLVHTDWRTQRGTITVLAERREDTLDNASLVGRSTRARQQNALGAGYGVTWNKHAVQLHVRHDRDSDFGGKTTATAAYGWDFANNWKATASAGTGFRVPTLYQRFSQYGQSSLKPEESLNTEVGVRWQAKGQAFSATAYRNQLTNMVSYMGQAADCAGRDCYLNVDKALLEGVTLAGEWRQGAVRWVGSVDFQNPRNTQTGRLLQRRSQRYATLGASRDWAGWDVGAQLQLASRRFNNDTEAHKSLSGYALWNFSAARALAPDWTLNARIDNALDRDYVLASTYATPGRTVWVGVKWMPQ